MLKKAIVIGATSGIGRELAKLLAENNYILGLTGRRYEHLLDLQKELPTKTFVKYMDVSQTEKAIFQLEELISELAGLDLIIINAGVNFLNPDLKWKIDEEIIMINALGFAAIANTAFKYFSSNKAGHIVAISSIAALRGSDKSPAYPASKAFVSNYVEGLRKKAYKLKLPIIITDIRPGYIKTEMTKGLNKIWTIPLEKATKQIYISIIKQKKSVYITKRWRLIAWIMKFMPIWLHCKI